MMPTRSSRRLSRPNAITIAAAGSSLEANLTASQLVGNVGYRGGLALIANGTAEATIATTTIAGNVSTAQGGITESSSGGALRAGRMLDDLVTRLGYAEALLVAPTGQVLLARLEQETA